ncbi:MAG: hypothetical protein IKC94_00050, partial [Lentisphaeria bacterium]|nr:hypothetical protein [Lentisphaeria bacterium]
MNSEICRFSHKKTPDVRNLKSKALFPILVDALCGMFNTRVRGGCRRARSPHANVLCEHFHASKADATNV